MTTYKQTLEEGLKEFDPMFDWADQELFLTTFAEKIRAGVIEEQSDSKHPTFYKTVVSNPLWKEWVKQNEEKPRWDVHESMEIGALSPEHFEAFLKFVNQKLVKKINQRKIDVLHSGIDWNETGRRDGHWELGYDDAITDVIEIIVQTPRLPCCPKCFIYLDYKDSYQCSDGECECHTVKST